MFMYISVCRCVYVCVFSSVYTHIQSTAVMSCCEVQGLSSPPLSPPADSTVSPLVKTSLDLASNQPHTETILLNPTHTVIIRDKASTALISSKLHQESTAQIIQSLFFFYQSEAIRWSGDLFLGDFIFQ